VYLDISQLHCSSKTDFCCTATHLFVFLASCKYILQNYTGNVRWSNFFSNLTLIATILLRRDQQKEKLLITIKTTHNIQ
jgi:hypothetical protein